MAVLISLAHSELERKCEEVLTEILRQCSSRFLKHTTKFLNEVKQARYPSIASLRLPRFSSKDVHTESLEDLEHLGPYSCENHDAYAQLACERLSCLRRICADLAVPRDQLDMPKMLALAKTAHKVRRSSSFAQVLRHNIHATQKSQAVHLLTRDLVERVGKISRFWRAARSLTSFGSIVASKDMRIQISCLFASRQTVPELSNRTPEQLRIRGGRHFQSCTNAQLKAKLQQWSRYRLHCEIQLIVFYQENPQLHLRSVYIGCDKLACCLCYNFITALAQFEVKGCHQALYSLWTVPQTLNFGSLAQALLFQNALRQLANLVERKVDEIRKAQTFQRKYTTNHESTANLSRVSLPLLKLSAHAPREVGLASETSSISDQISQSHSGHMEESILSSIAESADDVDHSDVRKMEQNSLVPSSALRTGSRSTCVDPKVHSVKEEDFCQHATQAKSSTGVKKPPARDLLTKQKRRRGNGRKRRIDKPDRLRGQQRRGRQGAKRHDWGRDELPSRERRRRKRHRRRRHSDHRTRHRKVRAVLSENGQSDAGLWHRMASILDSLFAGCIGLGSRR